MKCEVTSDPARVMFSDGLFWRIRKRSASYGSKRIHPGRLTWNLQITHLERKIIFQTSMVMFHVNLQGCMLDRLFSSWFHHGSTAALILYKCIRIHLIPVTVVVIFIRDDPY